MKHEMVKHLEKVGAGQTPRESVFRAALCAILGYAPNVEDAQLLATVRKLYDGSPDPALRKANETLRLRYEDLLRHAQQLEVALGQERTRHEDECALSGEFSRENEVLRRRLGAK